MQNVTKPAIAVGLLAALGIGCYTWGQHAQLGNVPSTTTTTATTSPSPLPAPVPAIPPTAQVVTPAVPAPRAGYPTPAGQLPPNSPAVTTVSTPVGAVPAAAVTNGPPPSQNWQTQPGTTETTTLTRQEPIAAAAPTTYVEKKSVTTTTTKPIHTAYTQRAVHYKHHKTDKVHVARATKHGAMFALKLPGRLAF